VCPFGICYVSAAVLLSHQGKVPVVKVLSVFHILLLVFLDLKSDSFKDPAECTTSLVPSMKAPFSQKSFKYPLAGRVLILNPCFL